MTNVAGFPLLSIILFLPLVGAAVLLFIPKENSNAIRWIANLVALAGFLVLFLFIWWLSTWYEELYPGDDTKAFALANASALLFFLSVVLHELGHAVVAMRNGIGIAGIDLWLFGGLARMKSDTRTPGQEFRIAAAGPAVRAPGSAPGPRCSAGSRSSTWCCSCST